LTQGSKSNWARGFAFPTIEWYLLRPLSDGYQRKTKRIIRKRERCQGERPSTLIEGALRGSTLFKLSKWIRTSREGVGNNTRGDCNSTREL